MQNTFNIRTLILLICVFSMVCFAIYYLDHNLLEHDKTSDSIHYID